MTRSASPTSPLTTNVNHSHDIHIDIAEVDHQHTHMYVHEVAPLQVVMEVSHFIIMVTNTIIKMMELHSHITVAVAAWMPGCMHGCPACDSAQHLTVT